MGTFQRTLGGLSAAIVIAVLSTSAGAQTVGPRISFGLADDPVNPPAEVDPELSQALDQWWSEKKAEILGGDFDVTFGAAIRVRAEYRDPIDYTLANSRSSEDRTFLRTKVHFGLQANEHLGGFIQLRDSRTWGEETPNSVLSDSEGVDLHQGYISLRNAHELVGIESPEGVTTILRAGRIEFPSLGDQRMFSKLDWSNVGRTFDGYHYGVTCNKVETHVLIATVNEGVGFDAGRDAHLYVIYIATEPTEGVEFDLYGAWRNYKTAGVVGEDGLVGDLEDQTYGARAEWSGSGFRVAIEGALQRGESANDDVKAYGWAAQAGYRARDVKYQPGVAIGVTYGSGDGNPNDGDLETFRPIAPFGHAYQGHYDIFSWQNAVDYYAKVVVQCCEPFALHADVHHFVLASEEDAWFDAGGRALRRDTTGTSGRTVGSELDIYVKGSVAEHLKVWAGWSHFWRGSYVRQTGGGDTGNFWFCQAELLFGK